jgi:uncharacterized protein (TIGR03118 family)
MAFLGDNDLFVLEKTTGKVDHVINGVVAATQFDFGAGPIANLPVNNNSERGLLGIVLSPNFANDHDVFLYWTESSTGAVSSVVQEVPVLGNRVDRFVWNAATSTLTFDRNIIRLHALQNDGNNVTGFQGNHNGGVLRFGPDGKLYIVIGDNGRRGWLQNLINGPQGPGQTDENFGIIRGGPSPDDAHLTGVLLRLNPDGSIPNDNPFVGISNTLSAPVLSGDDATGIGSFTAFLDQTTQTFVVHPFFQDLSAPTVAGQVRLGSPDGPVIFTMPDFPTGITSGEFNSTLTAANFVAEPPAGVNTLADAIDEVLNGNAYFSIYTSQFRTAAISGRIQQLDPEITTNLHRIFAYGIRNSFGYAFDPFTGNLWAEENGDISFDRITIVSPGSNNGWIQTLGPLSNFDGTLDETALQEYKSIEVAGNGLQQIRWPATNIADTVEEAFNRLVMLPGAHYNNPVFSVRAEDPPAGLGFLSTDALGPDYQGALFEGEARDNNGGPFSDPREQYNGALLVFHPNSSRTGIDFRGDPNIRTSDGVFENDTDFDLKGDTTIVLGRDFGVVTDIQTGPDGNLWLVSLSGGVNMPNGGSVYEIFRKGSGNSFHGTNLVADTNDPHDSTGQALGAPEIVDTHLVNPWGVSFSGGSPFWVANAGSGTSTLYSGDHRQPDGTITPITMSSLVVGVPPAPTGTVNNGSSTDFLLSDGTAASFLFDGLDGSIFGWHGGLTDAEREITVPGAVYTGMAIGNNGSGNFLYAANNQGNIDVFDTNFQLVTPDPVHFTFSDPNLPSGLTPYRPFNIQRLGNTLYVTYRNNADPEHGGIVDAYDLDGNFLRRVVSGGVNAPWGLALAPAGWGNFGGDLLVGNFGLGDGKINAYDPITGQFQGYISDADGNPLAVEGLWALAFGNGGSAGDPDALYFFAGINRNGPGSLGAHDGLFGSVRLDEPSSVATGSSSASSVALNQDVATALLGSTSLMAPMVLPAPAGISDNPARTTPIPGVQDHPLASTVNNRETHSAASHQLPVSSDSLGITLFGDDVVAHDVI